MQIDIIQYLLGQTEDAIPAVIQEEPYEVLEFPDNRRLLKFGHPEIREVFVSPEGRIIRCNYIDERRKHVRVTPADFIRVTVDNGAEELGGMLLDLSAVSLKMRSGAQPPFSEKDEVALQFSLLEGGEKHLIAIPRATVYKLGYRDEIYRVVFLFETGYPEEHPFHKYIACRCHELVHSKKKCVYEGGYCKGDKAR